MSQEIFCYSAFNSSKDVLFLAQQIFHIIDIHTYPRNWYSSSYLIQYWHIRLYSVNGSRKMMTRAKDITSYTSFANDSRYLS